MLNKKVIAISVFVLSALILSFLIITTYLPKETSPQRIPVLAHYYIWWTDTRWSTGPYKDFPLLGNYSSSDPAIVRQQIIWAKSAGISGWIVSWKGHPQRNAALSVLAAQAKTEDFGIVVWYESLDEDGNRRPISTVDTDFTYIITKYAGEPSFKVFQSRLAIILGQSDHYSDDEISDITVKYRPQVLILGSESDLDSYEKRSSHFDGNMYYWSSVDPYTNENYPDKLKSMSDIVHKHGGIWIAPVSPGYDSTLLGGSTVVPRKEGRTLSIEFDVALSSNPDAISIISWNEFGENTYIEPSVNSGNFYLTVVSSLISKELNKT